MKRNSEQLNRYGDAPPSLNYKRDSSLFHKDIGQESDVGGSHSLNVLVAHNNLPQRIPDMFQVFSGILSDLDYAMLRKYYEELIYGELK